MGEPPPILAICHALRSEPCPCPWSFTCTCSTITGYTKDPITQAATPIDEIRHGLDLFVGRPAAGGMESYVILSKDLLIQFAEDIWGLRRSGSTILNLQTSRCVSLVESFGSL